MLCSPVRRRAALEQALDTIAKELKPEKSEALKMAEESQLMTDASLILGFPEKENRLIRFHIPNHREHGET